MRKHSKNENCPYCLSPVKPEEEHLRCPKCGVIHHLGCWQANGACSVYGCDGWAVWNSRIGDKIAPNVQDSVVVTAADISAGKPVASDQQPVQEHAGPLCIKCGAPVKKNQLVCFRCKHAAGETHYFENCFGPAMLLLAGFVSTVVLIVRAVV